ncbi:MAG: hypothetical protein HZB55_07960 [Deltaproteobacteria bacterium]|nr:hypothetical protein [Deltaproteobacteria bacterium]
MAKVRSRRLVIDASVARSAGGPTATEPRSKACREFLLSVLSICHQVVMTPEIADEWKRHQSSFARSWRVQMEGRKKVFRPGGTQDESLLQHCERTFQDPGDQEAAAKDLHLLDAALATDRTIASLDEAAKGLFATLSELARNVAAINWVNPERPEEHVIAWLAAGAQREQGRQLKKD